MAGNNTSDGKLIDIYCKLRDIPRQQQYDEVSYSFTDLADIIFGNCNRLYTSVDNVIKTLEEIKTKAKLKTDETHPQKKPAVSSETRTDKCIKKIKDQPVISIIIIIGIITIAVGAVAVSLDNILSFWNKIAHSPTTSTNIFAYVSKDGTILRSKNFPWKISKSKDEEDNVVYIINGRYGDSSAASVIPDNSRNEYIVYNAFSGVAVKFTCPEEEISNFTIKLKY